MCLPVVSCSWPLLLGGDGEEEREHQVGVCLCVLCPMDMLPSYLYRCDVVLAIPSFARPLPS